MWRTTYKNYTPGTRQMKTIQDKYRNLTIGYAPFIPSFRIAGMEALMNEVGFSDLAYKQSGETLDSSYFYWGPMIGKTKEPFIKAMAKKGVKGESASFDANTQEAVQDGYISKTIYPWIAHQYKASYQYAGLLARFQAKTKGKFGNFTEPIPNMNMTMAKSIWNLIDSGFPDKDTLEGLQENLEPIQKKHLFSDKIGSWAELVETLDNIQGTLDGKNYKINKSGLNLTSRGSKKYKIEGGGTRLSKQAPDWEAESATLAKGLLGDIMKPHTDAKAQQGEEDNINYWAEAVEELGLSLLMDNYKELVALNENGPKNFPEFKKDPNRQQMVKDSGIGNLPDNLALSKAGGTRNAVDVAGISAEQHFMYYAASIDNEYGEDLRAILGVTDLWDEAAGQWEDPKELEKYMEKMSGTEVTLMRVQTKGGYKNLKDLGTVDNPLKDTKALKTAIDKINKDQINLINKYLGDKTKKWTKALDEAELAAKKMREAGKGETAEYNILDQVRQTLSRAAHADYLGVSDFRFMAPYWMQIKGQDGKEAGMISFGWSFSNKVDARAKVTETTVTSFGGEGYETDEGLKVIGILDLIMSALTGSAESALNWKADVFMDRLVREVTKNGAIEQILFEQLISTNFMDIMGQVGGGVTMSYKLPTAIAKELGDKWKKHLKKVAGDSEFMELMRADTKRLSENWQSHLNMSSWKGKMLKGGPSWWNLGGKAFDSGTGAWAVPFMAGGRAGAAAEPGKQSRVFKKLRLYSP